MTDIPSCVYRMYDSDGRLLYVGLTGRPLDRFSQHRRSKRWFREVRNIQVSHFEGQLDAQIEEAAAILNEGPAHNTPHRYAAAILENLLKRRAIAPEATTINELNKMAPEICEITGREILPKKAGNGHG